MKILIVSTPATGHLNPLLEIGRILMAEGHQVVVMTGTAFRERVEAVSAEFRALPPRADLDINDIHSIAPELKITPPGPEWLRIAHERIFVDTIPAQHSGLEQVLKDYPADVIIGDDLFFGVLPTLLSQRSKRPPIVLCGTTILHSRREDKAPHFAGLPPAVTKAKHEEYAVIAREHAKVVDTPLMNRANAILANLGARPLSAELFESIVELADAYMQLSVPGFEFPRELPSNVSFVGRLPFIPNQAPLPSWADELDGSRKVILVTQGTVANRDFGLLIEPTLEALANEPDVLVIATAGGRPIEALPTKIPSNARVASYLPFEWLLPKVDVFVTNGGFGSVNQAMSLGIPLVTSGLTEDKADVNARVAWFGVGIDLKSNRPTPAALRTAIRTVLEKPQYRAHAIEMATQFSRIDTRAEILRIVGEAARSRRVGSGEHYKPPMERRGHRHSK